MTMSQAGDLVLVNGTPYAWKQTNVSSYTTNGWSFPGTVPPRAVVSVHVDLEQPLARRSIHDDAVEVYFALEGTSKTFQLHADSSNGEVNVRAFLDGIATVHHAQGSAIDLGWHVNGTTPFILSGSGEDFFASTPPTNWMQSMLSTLGSKPLRHLCIPGSHDAGMSTISGGTAFGNSENTQTQTQNIGGQLSSGSRYFDIRPVITGGTYSTGHYSDIDVLGWQGANGESISNIISQINSFTSSNKELIVLNLSHDLNTDVGRSYRAFTQDEWNALFQDLLSIKNLFIAPNPSTVDLTTLTLDQFIGSGTAAVVLIVQPSDSTITLGSYAGKGFYTYSQFNAYNNYSDTDNLDSMISEQLDQLHTVRTSPDSQLFLLSWTLTQDAGDILDGNSILNLANEANPQIYTQLPPSVSQATFPNILYIDNFADSSLTSLAISISTM